MSPKQTVQLKRGEVVPGLNPNPIPHPHPNPNRDPNPNPSPNLNPNPNPNQALGGFLAYLYQRSGGSLPLVIVTHCTFNLAVALLATQVEPAQAVLL